LQSLARNDALAESNKRLALAATIAFLGMNAIRLTLSNNRAHDLLGVATGSLDDAARIATVLESRSAPRGP
jgi:death on curing protein